MPPHPPHHRPRPRPRRQYQSVIAPLYIEPYVQETNLVAEAVGPIQAFRVVGKIYKRNRKEPAMILSFKGETVEQALSLYRAHLKMLPMNEVTGVKSFIERWDGRVWRRTAI